jgi:hypothetical protein
MSRIEIGIGIVSIPFVLVATCAPRAVPSGAETWEINAAMSGDGCNNSTSLLHHYVSRIFVASYVRLNICPWRYLNRYGLIPWLPVVKW